ncbi:male sterility protein 2-related [Holotrichia oblita]|uniref:Male sterility protein 2-related n=1 Tax=Holotrichia oblita TaxID=644536 RepID=A0ACB9SRQ7_HOLOL|nr:male sterility protein 2-related [Holotrichia oblita]
MEIMSDTTIHQTNSEIQKFYDGKKVFITGGTGFLGKLLVEKLLRSTNILAIYFLIRPKKGKSIHTRLDEYFDDLIFQRLKIQNPKYKSKIIGIPGDCALAGLGLSIDDRQLLIDNVEVVFHAAATVNFTEKLKLAYSINVKGTEVVLNLCRQMRNLKSYIHVSTIYSQSHLREIDEIFYETSVNYRELDGILDKLDDDQVEKMTPKLLGNSPNTYTFTKGLAESLIKEQGSGLPIGVFRPAIVISTYKEPLEGWVDNLYGPTGICAAAASGLIRTFRCKEDAIANIVPADTCVASLIATAWDVANKTSLNGSFNIPIYNYSSTNENTITWREFHILNLTWAKVFPVSTSLWSVHIDYSESIFVYNLKKVLYHILPGTVTDALGLFVGKKPSVMKLYSKIHKFLDVLSYFSTKEWKCRDDNVMKLWCKMNERDRELFPFNMALVQWTTYFKSYMLGIRKYLLKDSENTIPKARLRSLR